MALNNARTWADMRRMNDFELSRLVDSGSERDSWLGMSSTALDGHFGKSTPMEHSQRTISIGLAPLHEWTDHLIENPSDNVLAPILVALASLTVGDRTADSRRVKCWKAYRNVDTLNQPHGYNIHLNIVQDKSYRKRHPPSHATVEAIFNIVDGVIVIRNVVEPQIPPAGNGDAPESALRLPEWWKIHQLVFLAWLKLHLPVRGEGFGHADYTGEMPHHGITNANDATLSQKVGIGELLKLRDLWEMLPWLNWIVINNRQDYETLQLIGRCLESRGHRDGHVPYYNERETFARGHWAFFALLGTEPGLSIVNFLALHKDNKPVDATVALGIKIIESITLFQPENPDELTDQERHLYAEHPVLIFQIKDSTVESELAKRDMENHFPDIPCPQI